MKVYIFLAVALGLFLVISYGDFFLQYMPLLVMLAQDISCIKDLTSLYETASIEDIYLAYEQLKVDENSLYSCIGVAGAQAGEEITCEDESHEGFPGVIPVGRGLSTMTRPTT